jgi:hypothetical protein
VRSACGGAWGRLGRDDRLPDPRQGRTYGRGVHATYHARRRRQTARSPSPLGHSRRLTKNGRAGGVQSIAATCRSVRPSPCRDTRRDGDEVAADFRLLATASRVQDEVRHPPVRPWRSRGRRLIRSDALAGFIGRGRRTADRPTRSVHRVGSPRDSQRRRVSRHARHPVE